MKMKRFILLGISLMIIVAAMAQKSMKLAGVKKNQETQLSIENYQVTGADQKTIVTMDFVLDAMKIKSARYRAFTPILRAKDGSQQQRLKSLLVTGRVQNIIFERDGIDPLYIDNCEVVRRENDLAQRVAYTDIVNRESWHKDAEVWLECDLCGCGDTLKS